MTARRSSPYLRRSSASRRRRSCTSTRRCGSSSQPSTSSRSVRARSDSSTAAAARRAWWLSKASRPASAAPGAAEQVEGPALAGGIDQVQRLERGVAVGGGVGQTVLLQTQRGLLVGILEVGGGDLLHLVAQDIRLPGALLRVTAQPRQRLVERVQLAPDGAHAAEIRAGEGVEDVALRGGRDEGPVLVLAVDLDQLGRRLAQRAQRGHAAVDPGPGAALGGDRTGQDHLAGGLVLPHARNAPRPGLPWRRRAPCRGWPVRPAPVAGPRRPGSCRRRSPR